MEENDHKKLNGEELRLFVVVILLAVFVTVGFVDLMSDGIVRIGVVPYIFK